LFYTSAVSRDDIFAATPPSADLRLPYGADSNQFVDVRLPQGKPPYPAVLFIHGGYWRARYDLTYAGHLCEALKKAGVATCNIEYRRVGNPGGGWPGSFEDVRSAYRMLKDPAQHSHFPQVNLKHTAVVGHSAGGQLALCLAAHEKTVMHAVSLAGVLDLRRAWELHLSSDAVADFLGGSPTEVPEHYREASPAVQSIPARQQIIHGTQDDTVPYEISLHYAERKKKNGEQVELITLPKTGHYEIVDPGSEIWPKIQEVLVAAAHG
jgi:acetyl esterase/lipase